MISTVMFDLYFPNLVLYNPNHQALIFNEILYCFKLNN